MARKRDYKYEVFNISKSKQAQNDYVWEAKKKPLIWAIGQIDVTDVKEYFRTHVDDQGKPYSFTAYIAYLLGQSILEHPKINAYMDGRKKLVVFEDVDIVCVVERYFEGEIVQKLSNINII